MKVLTQKSIKLTFAVVLLTSLFVLMIKLVNQMLFLEVKMLLMNLLKQFLRIMNNVKKQWKNISTKNLIMIEKEEEQFQSSNMCWIYEKLIDDDDKKVIGHFHRTGKFRGAAHWSYNMNLQLTKKVPVIFHNLRGYDSHLIFCELNNFDVKIDIIPIRLEKYMAFFK